MTRQGGMVGAKNVRNRNTFPCSVTASFVLEIMRTIVHLLYLKKISNEAQVRGEQAFSKW
jgi:hypothetical protein